MVVMEIIKKIVAGIGIMFTCFLVGITIIYVILKYGVNNIEDGYFDICPDFYHRFLEWCLQKLNKNK